MNATMPRRCLLVAPYCAARFTALDKHKHASLIRQGPTRVRSICSKEDESCSWQEYGQFIQDLGEVRDVTGVFPKHGDTLDGLLRPQSSGVMEDVRWLLGQSWQQI